MLRKTMRLLPLLALLIIYMTQCTKQEPVVARVGKETITLQAFEKDFSKGRTARMLEKADPELLIENLNKMVEARIMVQAAYKLGLDKDSTLLEQIKPFQMQVLNMELYQVEVFNRVIKESNLRDFYTRSRKKVTVHDLLFLVPKSALPEEDKDAKTRANQARERLLKGENSFAVAQDLVKDEKFKKRSGIVRNLKWSTSKDPIRKAVWSLGVGEVSDVIRNFRGYHVIKVEQIEDVKRLPYKNDKERIKRILTGENKNLLEQKVMIYFDNLEKKKGFKWNDDGFRFLSERILSNSRDASNQIPLNRLMALSDEEKAIVLLKHPDGQVTIGDILTKLKGAPPSAVKKIANIEYLKGQIRFPFIGDWLLESAFQKGLHKKKEVAKKLKDNLEANLVQALKKEVIIRQIDINDSVLQEYYETNKMKKYTNAAKIKLQEVKVQDKEVAQKIYKWIKDGRSMDKLVEQYSIRAGLKKKRGIIEISDKTKTNWGILGETAFSMNVGEIAGPIDLEKDDGYSVIRLLEKKAAETRPFKKVKNLVKRDYKTSIERERQEKWLDEQRKSIKVQIFEETLISAFIKSDS